MPIFTSTELLSAWKNLVVGQDEALSEMTPAISRTLAGFWPQGRPANVFFLLGPTGSGKTKAVEALAQVVHASHKKHIRIDCSEFDNSHEVAKLIGSPPGYLGHRETEALLTNTLLEKASTKDCPHAIILFDEFEKAHPALQRLLLGVLDNGTLMLGTNTRVEFERHIIFFSSNLGEKELMARAASGHYSFQNSDKDNLWLEKSRQRNAEKVIRRAFLPEFVNRLDAWYVFRQLDREDNRAILQREIAALRNQLLSMTGNVRGTSFSVSDAFLDTALERAFDPKSGARSLKRFLWKHLMTPFVDLCAAGEVPEHHDIHFSELGKTEFRPAEIIITEKISE